ncbi:MAG: hypothetical protein ACLSHC_08790 [Bilophila wadsworthia]
MSSRPTSASMLSMLPTHPADPRRLFNDRILLLLWRSPRRRHAHLSGVPAV